MTGALDDDLSRFRDGRREHVGDLEKVRNVPVSDHDERRAADVPEARRGARLGPDDLDLVLYGI